MRRSGADSQQTESSCSTKNCSFFKTLSSAGTQSATENKHEELELVTQCYSASPTLSLSRVTA